jgi:malto-oligosyltrehalose synthase/4-alpha-glucanotransferase
MTNPAVTYRIQFHKGFTFRQLEGIIPYLVSLGVGAVYASPIFESAPGSLHGYDGVNPHRVNPEIGTEDDLYRTCRKLRESGIDWIQDIVPNHMAFHSCNLWLMDVLEKGRYSIYANFFDLAWAGDLFHGRIMVPVLGAPPEDVLFNKELQVVYWHQRLAIQFHDHHYPLHPRSYGLILNDSQSPQAIQQWIQQVAELHTIDHAVPYSLRWHELLLQLDSLLQNEVVNAYIQTCLEQVNRDGLALKRILDEQTYTLTPWQVTDRRITFRRFFTVNELIGLNMHDEKVFDHYHLLIKKFVVDGVFQGLRIDHIDGLFDPQQYIERLRKLVGDDVLIYVEKILKMDETLPPWPIQGTTGYEYMALVNQLMTYAPAEKKFSALYKSIVKSDVSIDAEILAKKAHILNTHMQGELDNLYHLFLESNLVDKALLTPTALAAIKPALAAFLVHCPVYRYYGNAFPLEKEEAQKIKNLLTEIGEQSTPLRQGAAVLEQALLFPGPVGDETHAQRASQFYQRTMQFTGPLMAKGFEDTLFYTYNRFIGHNEVGDSPADFGITADEFHARMVYRQQHWPLSLNATSTHDTKRGEDVRARLNAITNLPEIWEDTVTEWFALTDPLKSDDMPDANDTYFIFQTLAGAYPLSQSDKFAGRLETYCVKALREGKLNSTWSEPNEPYETATLNFIKALTDLNSPFGLSLKKYLALIADGGLVNSLAQVVLKFTTPGVPDIYQGCEGWDFSLVDPDNRQAIDFAAHESSLHETFTSTDGHRLRSLWETRDNGYVKQWLIATLCNIRWQEAALFAEGDYIPLTLTGEYSDHAFAFARKHGRDWLVTVIPLHTALLAHRQQVDVLFIDWRNTAVVLPPETPTDWVGMLTPGKGRHEGKIRLSEIFKSFPLAVLSLKDQTGDRGAGVLLHVSSLPSPFAVGDLGSGAYAFVDFLKKSGQTYWQMLPLNPTHASSAYSPYSAFSSMAGNPLFISPGLLVEDGLLSPEILQTHRAVPGDAVDFQRAQTQKEELLDLAWIAFQKKSDGPAREAFRAFVEKEDFWLHDFALYVILKTIHQQSWRDWPAELRNRDAAALEKNADRYASDILKIKWQQFVFHGQWHRLKKYGNDAGIKLFGDLPFYVVYDSADVWSHPEIFSLDEARAPQFVAGVPPDYFNDRGQLWGMPVFNWATLRATNYEWWKRRLKKNMELFDMVRLDHFRAFAGFWQVAAGATDAVGGHWENGPGRDFFRAVERDLGASPFVAEDLGEITPDVYALRDAFAFPGMKVLQFAFGADMPQSLYAPHNYDTNFVVYTGTHDNNTTRGWFSKEIGDKDRERIGRYVNMEVSEENICKVFIRMAYASVARVAIVPLQDILGLDETARMNTPGKANANWMWRITKIPGKDTEKELRSLARLFNRI